MSAKESPQRESVGRPFSTHCCLNDELPLKRPSGASRRRPIPARLVPRRATTERPSARSRATRRPPQTCRELARRASCCGTTRPNGSFPPIADIRLLPDAPCMSGYRAPNWRDALRVYGKALRIIVEPAMVAVLLLALGVPWWGYVVLFIFWLPLGRIRVRQLRDDWVG